MRKMVWESQPSEKLRIAESDRQASPANIVKLKRQNQPKEIRR
jgi:hypothetical protein